MTWKLYLLECDENFFYTGISENVNFRLGEHIQKRGSKFTKHYSSKRIVHSEEFETKTLALKREKQIKGWSRAKKRALIAGNFILLKHLSKSKQPKQLHNLA